MKRAVVLYLLCVPIVSAQESRSHRKLELPQGRSSEVADRFLRLREMMQQKREQQQAPKEGGFSEGEMSFLKSMAEIFQQSGMLPDPSSIPPEVIDRIRKDPKAQQQAKELLQQFARDRQMPTAEQARELLNNFPGADSSQRQLTLPGTARDEQSQRQSPANPTGEANSNSSRQRSGEQNDRNSPIKPARRPQSSGKQTPSTQPSDRSRQGEDFLDQLIQQQRRNGETKPLSLQELADVESDKKQQSSNGTQNRSSHSSQPAATRPGQRKQSLLDAIEPSQKIDAFLEQLQDLNQSRQSSTGQNRSVSPSEEDFSESIERAKQKAEQQQKEKREAARKRVREKGLSGTLKDIFKDAKKEADDLFVQNQRDKQTEVNSQAADSGGVSKGMMNFLDGMKDDIVEIARDLKDSGKKGSRPPRRANRAQQNRTWNSGGSPSSTNREPGFLERIAKSLRQTGDTNEPVDAQTSLPADLAQFGQSQPVIGNRWITAGAILLIVFLAAVLLAGRFREKPLAVAARIQDAFSTRQPTVIRSRKDVVAAFHEVALSSEYLVQNWWTHEQAKKEIVRDKPQKVRSIDALASVYERARYLPSDRLFSETDLRQAREAFAEVQS